MRATAPRNETHRAFLPSRADAALAIPMTPGRASGSRQPFGEQDHGFAIHLGPVPLTHDLEICRAFTERRTRAPTVGLQQIGRRGEHIRYAMPEIDTAVSVIIDAVFDIGGRQKLRLADLPRIGADHVAQRKIAALDDLQRGEKLALKQFGAATIMRHRGERADHRQVAHVAGAVIGFEAPDRNDQWTRHAELPLNAREQRRMALQHLLAALDADGGNAGRGVILEAFAKSAALAAVEGEHRRIESDAGERVVDDGTRDAGGGGLARNLSDEGAEVPAALRRESGPREQN